MTDQVATAFFENRADVNRAIDELVQAGVSRANIRVMPETDAPNTSRVATQSAYDANRDEKGFWASLGEMFFPVEDRYTYAEALHRGDIMVSVTVDSQHAERVEDILEKYGTVDIAEREASWRQQGWTGYAANAGAPATKRAGAGEDVLPIVEEKMTVGKRQVSGGRIKVRSYVVETPVHEQVNLRNERLHVERRQVDRPAGRADDAMFRDRTIEATENREEAVVSKEARVTEEVVLKKDVEQRTETVSDTVRSTKVEVDDQRNGSKTGPAPKQS